MRHGATILWAVLATVAGTGLFMLKYQVQGEEQRLRHLQKQIVQTEEEIHVLKAEWSYLNEPTRLRELAERNLSMHPMKATQLSSIDSFGMAPQRPDDQAQPPGNQFAEDQQQPQAAPVSTTPEPQPDQSLPQAPQMARPLQQAPMPGMVEQAPVRSFDIKAVAPTAPVAAPVVKAAAIVKPAPVAKAVPAAVKIPAKPAPKAVLKTAAIKPATKPVTVAANVAPASKAAVKSSYPSIYPTYASYPTNSAPVATQASAPGNVMVITSPALGGR